MSNEINPSMPAPVAPPRPPHPGDAPPHPGYGQTAPLSDVAKMMQYDAAKKSAGIAYLLWFFLGGFGAHRFYLGQIGTGVAQLLILVFSFILTFVAVGLLGFLVLGVWVIVDAFLIPGIVQRHNQLLASQMALR